MSKLVFLLTLLIIYSCTSPTPTVNTIKTSNNTIEHTHDTLGQQFARSQITKLLLGKAQPFTWDTLIKTPATAIAMAEPILFDVFGKEQIVSEKPYEVYLIDGYWYLAGTIPKGVEGGGFEIIFSAKDAKIIRLTHYK
jgi:hypothetical protein